MTPKERLIRNARIAECEQQIKELNFTSIKIIEDIRSYLDPVEFFSDMSKIHIEKADILFRKFKIVINEIKEKKEELEYLKES